MKGASPFLGMYGVFRVGDQFGISGVCDPFEVVGLRGDRPLLVELQQQQLQCKAASGWSSALYTTT